MTMYFPWKDSAYTQVLCAPLLVVRALGRFFDAQTRPRTHLPVVRKLLKENIMPKIPSREPFKAQDFSQAPSCI